MPPFLPAINNPSTANTGLIVSGDSFASEPFGNGLAYPSNHLPNFNTISTQPLTPGTVPKPPPVDVYHSEATRFLGEGTIGRYLHDFDKKPQNEVFEDLVNGAVSKTGKTFETDVMKDLLIHEITEKYEKPLAQAVNDIRQNQYDQNREIKLYRLFRAIGAELNKLVQSDVPVQADAVPVDQTQSAPSQGWLSNFKFWGGRKTARNHKRSRSHKRNHSRSHKRSRSRSRSRKQYKKLKRSSRNRRRR